MNCPCGAPVFIKKRGLCMHCYGREYRRSHAEPKHQAKADLKRALSTAYDDGATIGDLARTTNKCERTVRTWLTSCGVSLRRGPMKLVKPVKVPWTAQCKESQLPRVMARVAVVGPDECWSWKGGVFRPNRLYPNTKYPCCSGYEHGWLKAKRTTPYRLIYEHHYGPIPEGMTVDHLCFNTLCCNPAHLQLLTRGENAARKSPAGLASISASSRARRRAA